MEIYMTSNSIYINFQEITEYSFQKKRQGERKLEAEK